MSWSSDNREKRLFGCKNYGTGLVFGRKCHYFSWYDPPIGHHEKIVTVGLLKSLKNGGGGGEEEEEERLFMVDYIFDRLCNGVDYQ
ncbi:hypothetical protein Goari_014669, partial [Gossypium aridum]|nr:hypothetical protein [Gossypium aridum]